VWAIAVSAYPPVGGLHFNSFEPPLRCDFRCLLFKGKRSLVQNLGGGRMGSAQRTAAFGHKPRHHITIRVSRGASSLTWAHTPAISARFELHLPPRFALQRLLGFVLSCWDSQGACRPRGPWKRGTAGARGVEAAFWTACRPKPAFRFQRAILRYF
jgi:hypothetical protein